MEHGYMEVVEAPRRMKGKGAPKDTLFGVIGHTKADPMARSLGGLMITTTKGASPAKVAHKAHVHPDTEKHLIGGKHATALPGVHYGQIPFAGQYMKAVGKEVS